jgi:multiple sugar transport system permease protein/putative aldouronate transport system permease protein
MGMTAQKAARAPRARASDTVFAALVHGFVTLFALFCLIPFWLMVINSFATEASILRNGFSLWPEDFSLYAYQFLFRNTRVMSHYGVSVAVTLAGTVMAVAITSMFAYGITSKKLKRGSALSFMTYFTMLFGSGIVGFYLLVVNWLHLKDNIFAMILPYLMNPFYVFVLVSFFRTLPDELAEAALIDGANDARIFFQIILPLSKPAITTVTLFFALQYWNDYYLALLFVDDYKLYPLQMMIRTLISNMNAQQFIQGSRTNYAIQVPTYGIQLATVCVTIGPILLLYPFLQKHFVKGLTIGAVKG